MNFLPTAGAFYGHLTDQAKASTEQEAGASEDSFDKTIYTLFNEWVNRRGIAEDAPSRLENINDLFIQYPNLNDKSLIHFQGGAEFATSRFVHVRTGRVTGKAREETSTRYYLNPLQGLHLDKMIIICYANSSS